MRPRSAAFLFALFSVGSLALPATALGAYSEATFQDDFAEAICGWLVECFQMACPDDIWAEDYDDCLYDAKAAKECVDGLAELTCDSGFDSFPAACDDVYLDCDQDDYADDEDYDEVGDVSGNVTGQRETLRDELDADVSEAPTPHSDETNGSKEGAGDHTETKATAAADVPLSDEDIRKAFGNTYYPCGHGPHGVTLCANAGAAWAAGRYVVVMHVLQGDVPTNDPINLYQYGFVFDADGDSTNNYVPAPPYTADFFRDTDRWYEVDYDPVSGWILKITDARDGNFTPYQSTARAIIAANTITIVIPREEFSASNLTYRVTAFRHTGDFGLNPPFDWNGDVEPPVGQTLKAIPELSQIPEDRGLERDRGEEGEGGSGGTGPAAQDGGGGGGCSIGPETRPGPRCLPIILAVLALVVVARRSSTRMSSASRR